MMAASSVSMVLMQEKDIRKKIEEAFKETVLEKDTALQTRILDLVLNERIRCTEVALSHRRFATSSLEEVAKEIAEGERETVRCKCGKNGKDCC